MAVGALEQAFYAELLRLLDLDVDPADQHDRQRWPELRAALATAFRARTQAEWTQVFDGTDACVAPVVGLRDAAAHPHIAHRGSVVEVDGVLQPGTAPRFSAHPVAAPPAAPAPGRHTAEVLAEAGFDAEALVAAGVAVQA
jgi:alpha-methylacyl-CoA racemase